MIDFTLSVVSYHGAGNVISLVDSVERCVTMTINKRIYIVDNATT